MKDRLQWIDQYLNSQTAQRRWIFEKSDCKEKMDIRKDRLQSEDGYYKRQIEKGILIFEKSDCKGKIEI